MGDTTVDNMIKVTLRPGEMDTGNDFVDVKTQSPTNRPTEVPTSTPSSTPSVNPTSTPSMSPTNNPTDAPTPAPTSPPTASPSSTPSINPTSTPSTNPTSNPTNTPSDSPSEVPTPCPLDECGVCNGPGKIACCDGRKVCDKNECPISRPISVCIALDESGSVCSIGSPNLCEDLATQAGNTNNSCDYENNCPNFNDDTKEFANTLITGLDAVTLSSDFSVVSFARFADKDTPLTSAINAIDTINNLEYSGGWTNTQAAINECRLELQNAPADHLKFLVIVTDGLPTNNRANTPSGNCNSCSQQAIEEANAAKK